MTGKFNCEEKLRVRGGLEIAAQSEQMLSLNPLLDMDAATRKRIRTAINTALRSESPAYTGTLGQ
jgi:hypothetical protein